MREITIITCQVVSLVDDSWWLLFISLSQQRAVKSQRRDMVVGRGGSKGSRGPGLRVGRCT